MAHPPIQLKAVIGGGFGSGKTTFVGSISEIEPLSTEAVMTEASVGTDDLAGVESKNETTVALDFGRRTFPDEELVLYLFGTPGQRRFWFTWDDLCVGALGAVVLADTRRLQDSFPVVEFFERRGIAFVVAINQFDEAFRYSPGDVRQALRLSSDVPVMTCDAREKGSARAVLIRLLEFVLSNRSH